MIRSSKIRTLSAVAFAILLPVVAQATTTTAATTHKTKAHVAAASKKAARMPAVDINSASKDDLMKLNGITDETAEKIIAGRPYMSKTELVKKNILTKAEYAKVRSHVIAKQEKTAKAAENKAPESTPATTTPETGGK
jgi:competence protein ComEA